MQFRGWGGDGKSCLKGRYQGQFCLPESITEPLALGEAILFNGFFQSGPYAFVITRLIFQPPVEKLDCCRVLGSLCHSAGLYSLGRPDVLLFISHEPHLFGQYLASTPAHIRACPLPRGKGNSW